MKQLFIFLLLGLSFSCHEEDLNMSSENQVYEWEQELYQVIPSYKDVYGIKIEDAPTEKLISNKTVKLSSQQAQQQQDSLFQHSNGQFRYRFKKIKLIP